jgi:RimJ/RimL family protein N-acetyltransferase
VFERFFAEALESGGALAVIADNAGVVGSSRFRGYDERRDEVEIGWTFLARSHWGGSTNRELKRLMLGHAFCSIERAVFLVSPENHRSQRALEKIGAERAGTRSDGSGRESVLLALRQHDFSTHSWS